MSVVALSFKCPSVIVKLKLDIKVQRIVKKKEKWDVKIRRKAI